MFGLSGERKLIVPKESNEVRTQCLFSEHCAIRIIVGDQPMRLAFGQRRQQQLYVRATASEMFNVRAGQAATANNAVARSTRPATLNRELANAAPQRHLPAHHSGVATRKPVRLFLLDLNSGAGAICLSGE